MTAYTTDELRAIWHDDWMLAAWRTVEIEALRAQIEIHGWPADRLGPALAAPAPTVFDWRKATLDTGHEFVAFLDLWDVPWVHIGLTSSDVIDTALAMRVKETSRHLLRLTYAARDALADAAWEHRNTRRLGRTHGQAATATTLGHRFADLAHALDRCAYRLQGVTRQAAMCQISGPVGVYEQVSPAVEQKVAQALGLAPAPASTQIVMRDSLAAWAGVLAVTASVCEAVAMEIRLSAHSQVGEVRERDGDRRGSSAMPHKSNPIMSERITGLARLARSSFEPLAAGVAQFHDRDLAHSSVERTLLPQLSGAVAYSLTATADVVKNLQTYPLTMIHNLRRHEVDVATHAAQTHLQMQGMTHRQAQDRVRLAWRGASNSPQFWDEINRAAGVVYAASDGHNDPTILSARQFGLHPTATWKDNA